MKRPVCIPVRRKDKIQARGQIEALGLKILIGSHRHRRGVKWDWRQYRTLQRKQVYLNYLAVRRFRERYKGGLLCGARRCRSSRVELHIVDDQGVVEYPAHGGERHQDSTIAGVAMLISSGVWTGIGVLLAGSTAEVWLTIAPF